MEDKISIIIPTYNRKNYLGVCIDSILNQTYKNVEIIIIDDASTDGTDNFIKEKYYEKVIYMKNEKNIMAGDSRKRGYEISTGNYIIFCDDDDYYIDNNFFKNAVDILKNKEILMVCSNTYTKYELEAKKKFWRLNFKNEISSKEYLKNFQIGYSKPNSTFSTIFRKESLENSDLRNMKMMNDSSIYMRALLNDGRIYIYDNPTGYYRIHLQNITFNLNSNFIIQNLDEKKWIYDKILEKKIFSECDEWFEKQVIFTIRYYIAGSNRTRDDNKKIKNWLKVNIKKYRKVYFKIFLINLKMKIKNLLEN